MDNKKVLTDKINGLTIPTSQPTNRSTHIMPHSNDFEFQNTFHTTPAQLCAHLAHSYITSDGYNDPEDVSIILKRYTADELTDECIEGWNLHEQWLTERKITRADILHAIEHFIRYRPDQTFSDEELRESERDYQNDIAEKEKREDRAFGG